MGNTNSPPSWSEPRTYNDGDATITYRHCTNWTNNNAESCYYNKPSDTLGWVSAALNTPPNGNIAFLRSSDNTSDAFTVSYGPIKRCGLTRECYAITNESYNTNSKTTKKISCSLKNGNLVDTELYTILNNLETGLDNSIENIQNLIKTTRNPIYLYQKLSAVPINSIGFNSDYQNDHIL